MKMDPIVYRLEVKEKEGFTPFKREDEYIFQRNVLVKPFRWSNGYAITFEINERFCLYSIVQSYDRKLCELTFYDKDCEKQALLIQNLASNDLRGYVAESTAHALYWQLFAFSDEMKQFLPELVEFYEKTWKNTNA